MIGAAIAVHRSLGPGFLESIYRNALGIELRRRRVPFVAESSVEVYYCDEVVGFHRVDLFVAEKVIVEIKAVARFDQLHTAQVISYLRATKVRVGLLINFNSAPLIRGVKRIVA